MFNLFFQIIGLCLIFCSSVACDLIQNQDEESSSSSAGSNTSDDLPELPDEGPGVCEHSWMESKRGVNFSSWNSNCVAVSLDTNLTIMSNEDGYTANFTIGDDGLLTSFNGVACCLDHAYADRFDSEEF